MRDDRLSGHGMEGMSTNRPRTKGREISVTSMTSWKSGGGKNDPPSPFGTSLCQLVLIPPSTTRMPQPCSPRGCSTSSQLAEGEVARCRETSGHDVPRRHIGAFNSTGTSVFAESVGSHRVRALVKASETSRQQSDTPGRSETGRTAEFSSLTKRPWTPGETAAISSVIGAPTATSGATTNISNLRKGASFSWLPIQPRP